VPSRLTCVGQLLLQLLLMFEMLEVEVDGRRESESRLCRRGAVNARLA